MQTYTLRLTGPGVPGDHRLPGALVRDLLDALDALDRGARGAVRLRLEGYSASRGPTPGWLDRAALRGVYAGDDGGQLKAHFGQMVAVSGTGHFKPSGALRVIEADHVAYASEGDLAVFAEVPVPLEVVSDARVAHSARGSAGGIAAIFGKWPGDESDEEILRILDELS